QSPNGRFLPRYEPSILPSLLGVLFCEGRLIVVFLALLQKGDGIVLDNLLVRELNPLRLLIKPPQIRNFQHGAYICSIDKSPVNLLLWDVHEDQSDRFV